MQITFAPNQQLSRFIVFTVNFLAERALLRIIQKWGKKKTSLLSRSGYFHDLLSTTYYPTLHLGVLQPVLPRADPAAPGGGGGGGGGADGHGPRPRRLRDRAGRRRRPHPREGDGEEGNNTPGFPKNLVQ